MKLNEIRDISDYRSGDESDPRSPYYEDPFPNGIPDQFMPNVPQFVVNATGGQRGDTEYTFTISVTYDRKSRDEYGIIEIALDSFAGDKRFANAELVDETDELKGNQLTYTQYMLAGRGFPVDQVQSVLNQYAKDHAEQIAEKNAYDTVARDGRDWDRPDDY